MSIELMVSIISVTGVILSALVAYITSLKVQRNSYRDEYYKTIIAKRLEAYEYINNQLMVMRLLVFDDDDRKYYHVFFDNGANKLLEYQNNLHHASARSIWFSAEMIDAIGKLSSIFYEINNLITDDTDQNVEIGKKYHERLRSAQLNVSKALVADIADLYDVDSFIKSKKNAYNKKSK